MKRAVKITGMGCICAAGNALAASMSSMYASVRNCSVPSLISASLEREYPVFEVKHGLENLHGSRTLNLAWKALYEALEQSGLEMENMRGRNIGVCIGTTVGCTLNNEPFYRDFKAGKKPDIKPVHDFLSDNPALDISRKLGTKGPVACPVNACASGTDAIGIAASWIRDGICDIAIAGGADELSRITYLGFISLLISATSPCRPFDKNRDGLNLGEGAGILILESDKRGQKSLGKICGYGTSSDAYHPTRPHPEGKGLLNALSMAFTQAGISPGKTGFINAHGTSTPDNDRAEGKVIKSFFFPEVPVFSSKAYTGHTLGAAGAIEAVFTVQSLLDGRLPATAGFTDYDEACGIIPTTENIEIDSDYAVSSSLAFGGGNSCLIFRKDG